MDLFKHKDNIFHPDVWETDFAIGIEQIDEEHAQLFRIIQKILKLVKQDGREQFACVEGIKYLYSHTLQHFENEEEYMRSVGYDGYEMHRLLHETFRTSTLPTAEQDLKDSDYSKDSIERFLGICVGWLVGHTLFEDRAIAGKISSQWDGGHDPDVNTFLQKALVRVMQELVHLELRPVNLHYSGERLGPTMNYQVIYSDGGSDLWQVTVALETNLILQMVRKLFVFPTDTITTVVTAAFKQIIQQIIHRIGVFNHSENNFVVKQDTLLTDKEWNRLFRERCPKYSQLFSTAYGFFVFAVDQWEE